MLVLVTYDVSTRTKAGQKRLRRISDACQDWGQRVQNSVFECEVDWAQFVEMKASLVAIADLKVDSVRFYLLGNEWKGRVEHFGAKPSVDLRGPLLV
jgi:CRISPR-associated protein Cas2